MKTLRSTFFPLVFSVIAAVMAISCSTSKYLPDNASLLDRIDIVSDSADLDLSNMNGYIRQKPNNKWFSVFNAPVRIYSLAGRNDKKWVNRVLKKIGEAPVAYDEQLAKKAQADIRSAMQNLGYLNAQVDLVARTKKRHTKLIYHINPNVRYRVRNLSRIVPDTAILFLLTMHSHETFLKDNMCFDLNLLDKERSRIHTLLQNHGYYKFNKDYISFLADTTVGRQQVDLTMRLHLYPQPNASAIPHQVFRIGNVTFHQEENDGMRLNLRPKVLQQSCMLEPQALYREEDVQSTYSHFMQLSSVMNASVRFEPDPNDSLLLNSHIYLAPTKLNSINFEIEGTNSAGDLGAAISTSYNNRNIFHGGEIFTFKLRGAYEAIKGLNGYSDQDYIEYSAEMGITFPHFKFPFISHKVKQNMQATSEIRLMYDSQDRPEFHRRVVAAAWRYRWTKPRQKQQHKIDLLDLNYVFMPWISRTFRELYLENPNSKNAILKYNYENLFIMKWGYSFTYNSMPISAVANNYGTNAYIVRMSAESAGNFLYGMSNLFSAKPNAQNQYTLFNIAYAQYVKADFDFSKSFRLDDKNSFAIHVGLGIACPYGNSRILPYEKRYFSGGANSVRGWSVRGLGPGRYNGSDGRIDFINQTGDVKLDLNAEYRTHLLWKLHAAVFIDAGNIWTLRDYAEQPGGQFRFDTFWKQIAMAYGIGFRLNFDYFILRLDGGMKAIHPAYTDVKRHFPIIHPNFKRDFTLHFAVGLPF